MSEPYLAATFRRDHAFAAAHDLPRENGFRSHRTELADPGILIDCSEAESPGGIEIAAPAEVTVTALNRMLCQLGQLAVCDDD